MLNNMLIGPKSSDSVDTHVVIEGGGAGAAEHTVAKSLAKYFPWIELALNSFS